MTSSIDSGVIQCSLTDLPLLGSSARGSLHPGEGEATMEEHPLHEGLWQSDYELPRLSPSSITAYNVLLTFLQASERTYSQGSRQYSHHNHKRVSCPLHSFKERCSSLGSHGQCQLRIMSLAREKLSIHGHPLHLAQDAQGWLLFNNIFFGTVILSFKFILS